MHRPMPAARPVAAIAFARRSCRGEPTASSTNRAGCAIANSTARRNATGSCSNPRAGSWCAGGARPQRATRAASRSGSRPMMVSRSPGSMQRASSSAARSLPGTTFGAASPNRRAARRTTRESSAPYQRVPIDRPQIGHARHADEMIGVRRDDVAERRRRRARGEAQGQFHRIAIGEIETEQPYRGERGEIDHSANRTRSSPTPRT